MAHVNLMAKNEIRLRYSGFVIFASRLISVGTGLTFVLLLTRSVAPEEFGVWGNMTDLLNYFIILSSIIPFWTTRFVARGATGSAKTGLVANTFLSIATSAIYLVMLPIILVSLQVTSYATLYAIVSMQILGYYSITTLESILQATKPQAIGQGLLISEVCKIAIGFVLIVGFHLGLFGEALSGAFYIG